MTVEQVCRILHPGVRDLLSQTQAVNLVLSLIILATDPIDPDTLRFFVRFFTPADYDDLVEERKVLSRCGYPLCAHRLTDCHGHIRKQPSLSINPWGAEFCSRHCYQASSFYKRQLPVEALTTRKDVAWKPFGEMHFETTVLLLDEVEQIAKVEHKPVSTVVRELILQQAQVETDLASLALNDKDLEALDLGDALTKIKISETQTSVVPPSPPRAPAA